MYALWSVRRSLLFSDGSSKCLILILSQQAEDDGGIECSATKYNRFITLRSRSRNLLAFWMNLSLTFSLEIVSQIPFVFYRLWRRWQLGHIGRNETHHQFLPTVDIAIGLIRIPSLFVEGHTTTTLWQDLFSRQIRHFSSLTDTFQIKIDTLRINLDALRSKVGAFATQLGIFQIKASALQIKLETLRGVRNKVLSKENLTRLSLLKF